MSGIFADPFEDMPFDIVVTGIQQVNKLKVKSDYGRPADAWDGPGLKAKMQIDDGGCVSPLRLVAFLCTLYGGKSIKTGKSWSFTKELLPSR